MAETGQVKKNIQRELFQSFIGHGIRNNLFYINITFKSTNLINKILEKFNEKFSSSILKKNEGVMRVYCQEVEVPTIKQEPGEEIFRNFSLPKAPSVTKNSKLILWNDAYDMMYDFWSLMISTINNTRKVEYPDNYLFDVTVNALDLNSLDYKTYIFKDCYGVNISEKKFSDKPLSLEDMQFTLDFVYRDIEKKFFHKSHKNSADAQENLNYFEDKAKGDFSYDTSFWKNFRKSLDNGFNVSFSDSAVAARLLGAEAAKLLQKFSSSLGDRVKDFLSGKTTQLDITASFRETFEALGEDISNITSGGKTNKIKEVYDNAKVETPRIENQEEESKILKQNSVLDEETDLVKRGTGASKDRIDEFKKILIT